MASPTIVSASTPIAQLNPDLRPDECSVTGVVTLIWPYASSQNTFGLLLVEPDFRLRSNRGQVRVHFQGSSAKAVARSGISSGDRLLLNLRGAQWAKDSTAATTPGRGIDWQLQYGERLVLQIQRPSQPTIFLDVDHPTPSPEPSVQTSTPARSPPHNDYHASSSRMSQLNAQLWASPAFLKRSHFLATDYDPFAEEEFPDNDRRKRTRFGRDSGQWRFAERTPSPEKEPETPPFENASPSRLTAQDRPRGEEDQSHIQQAHATWSSKLGSSVAVNALTDRSELEFVSEGDSIAKNTSFEERNERLNALNQVNGLKHMTREVVKDESIGDNTFIPPKSPRSEIDPNKIEGEVTTTRPITPSSKTYVGDKVPQQAAQIVRASTSVPIEIPSPAPSPSALENDLDLDEESDQESNDASHQGSESLLDMQSESGQSNPAVYSGPASDYGLDGSAFSRPPPSAKFSTPPGVIKRLEEGLEVDGMNKNDAGDILSPLQSDVKAIEYEAEEPSSSRISATESMLSKDEGSGEDIDTLESHDAAQRRSIVQTPSDQFESSEARELDDEAMKQLAAAQLLTSGRGPWIDAGNIQDENAMRLSSRNPPSPSNQVESQESQEELVLRSSEIPNGEVGIAEIPAKTPLHSPERRSLLSSREKFDSSEASDEEDTPERSPEKGPVDSTEPQDSLSTDQQDIVLDAKLSENSKILPLQGREVRDRAENSGTVAEIQQTTAEIIDLESDDEDDLSSQNDSQKVFQVPVDENDSKLALTHTMTAYRIPLPLVSDASDEPQISIEEANRVMTLRNSTGLALKPITAVEDSPPADTQVEPEAHEEALKPEQEGFRTQSPVVRIERDREGSPLMKEFPLLLRQEASRKIKDGELPSEENEPLKQSARVGTELRLLHAQELPSTVPDSFENVTSKSQLLTPSSTQQTNLVSQSSSVSLHSAPEDDILPTPRLTQGTSAGIVPLQPLVPPEEPALEETVLPPKKTSALIERLKEMRRLSNLSPKARSSDASILDPWFAPRRPSQVVPDSEDGSEAESSPEREAQVNVPKTFGRQLLQTSEKPLAKSFIRSPSQPKHICSIQSSPQYLPPSQPPPPGFRTNLSYFVPLATLTSHFATTVDVLAIALSGTQVTRATSGPRDYNQSIYLTDPSSSALQHSITTAQIFRPNNRCFPLVEKGEALLLRDFKVQPFQKRLLLLSTESSAWAVFRKGADVQIRGPPVEFGAEERGFARGLWDWWASLGDDARKRLEDAVPEYKKPNSTAKSTKPKAGERKSDVPIKKEKIEGLGVDLPGSQSERRESIKERSLALDSLQEKDMVHESIEAPRRVLRARGARGANGRSESARESRFGTVFTGGLGEPDETQGSAHELRDGKAYRAKGR